MHGLGMPGYPYLCCCQLRLLERLIAEQQLRADGFAQDGLEHKHGRWVQ